EWLINEKQLDVFGMKLPTGFQLIGQVVCICTWDVNVTQSKLFWLCPSDASTLRVQL
ncbi:hypothetical protein XENORESO_022245, partial [Xenotaenia resolanae]